MVKSVFVLILAILSTTSVFSQAAEYQVTLSESNIEYFYIHTNEHSTDSVRNIAVLDTTSSTILQPNNSSGQCDGGFWLHADTNSAAYSMLLASITAKKDINIYYSDTATPWGNIHYCLILRVGVR